LANSNEASRPDKTVPSDPEARIPEPKTSEVPEPTYNGVTLSQWLRLLETERNPEKIAELRTSSHRKPTRDFFAYFLTWSQQGAANIYSSILNINKRLLAVDQVRIADSIPQRKLEIRKQSRRFISALVDAVSKDESLLDWSVRCADKIVHISDQPITAYPDLVPLIERLFEHPATKWQGGSSFYASPVAAILLGESSLHVPEIMAYAAEQFNKDNVYFSNGRTL
jgi:hypothetical protein